MKNTKVRSKNKDGYRSISLPEDLINLVEKVIEEHPEYGYKSLSEFIKDAIKSKLVELERMKRLAKVFE